MLPRFQFRQLHSAGLLVLLGGGTAGIVCAFAYIISWVLAYSAASLDRSEFAAEQRLLNGAISSYQSSLARNVADITSWTELYENFEGPGDAHWEAENLGPYLAPHFDVDEILVAAKSGALVYRYSRAALAGKTATPAPNRDTLKRLSYAAFDAEKPDVQVPVAGVVELNGRPCIVVAATIRPSSLKETSHFSLVEVRYLSDSFMERFGDDYGIARLRARALTGDGLGLITPDGKRSRYELTWHPMHPGQMLLDGASSTIKAVTLATMIALLGLIIVLWSIARNLRSGEARALRAELEATEIRASAAEETNRTKSAFIANMSHELRTPLNAIIGLSQIISSQLFGPLGAPKYLEYAADIQKSSKRLLKLVDDILQLATIDTASARPPPERINLFEVVDESLGLISAESNRKKLSIDVRVDREIEILAERDILLQILSNILSNSVKFSFEGGLVVVSALYADDFCELRIEDKGCGIPPGTLTELGKPFVQAEGVYSRSYQGAGLGFAICFRLAERVGAILQIDSEVGMGTIVRLRLRRPSHYKLTAEAREAA